MFREFVVAKQRSEDAAEHAMFQAYQTVRIGLMVKRKTVGKRTTVEMPKWQDVIGKSNAGMTTLNAGDSHEKGRAFLQMVAAHTGGKVRRISKP